MRPVQPVSVHIAVLSVAKDPKHPDHGAIAAAVERATAAGHQLVEQAIVKDSEPAVREQLTRWITDSNVDVVLVLGGADSETASSALRPLVSSVLPGFTDLFRWLAFQEIGASAMLSQAEAAQCGQAYVFVLPGAIAAAMDKLILPQLDPNTTPKNLISSLPRLQARSADAVPAAIHGEKTQGGAGLTPKLPALPQRKQTKTGANVIPRNRAVDDPPTKPIDLERLQRELARSEVSDQQTRKTDLAKLLPKLPPGADEDVDEDLTEAEILAAPPPPGVGVKGPMKPQTAAERARHEAATPPSPTPIVVPPAALKPTVPAVIPPIAPRRPPTAPPQAPVRPASSPTTAGGQPPRSPAQIPSLVKPGSTKPASPGATALSAAWSKPESPPPDAKAGAFVDAKTTPSTSGPWIDAKTTPAPKLPKTTPLARTTPASGAPVAEAVDTKTLPIARVATPETGTPIGGGALPVPGAKPLRTPASPSGSIRVATGTDSGSTRASTEPRATFETPAATNGATAPAASPSKTPTTELDPSELTEEAALEEEPASTPVPMPVAAAPSQRLPRAPTPPPMPAVRTRQPTPPPLPAVKPPVAAEAPALQTSASDLPRGTFTYPVQRKKSGAAIKLLALAAAAGLGFLAFVYIVPMFMKKDAPATTTAQVEPARPPVETPPAEDTGSAVVEPPPVEPPPVEPPPVETPPVQRPTQRPTTRPGHATTRPPVETPAIKPMPTEKPVARPPVEAPVEDDGCDETSCILSKYEKACCEKYKPKTSDLSARTGGGLPENLDKMMVRAGVEKVKPRIVTCGEKAAVKGTVKIAMTVSPAGVVTSAEVAETPDAGLGTCVLGAMKAATFGKSVNGGTFTYPFAF